MNTYICQICGEAYLGEEKPRNCPFCGAREGFIRNGNEANPVINEEFGISEISKKNLETTLKLEMKAQAIYQCMSDEADSNEVKMMFKRLSKVEQEHANAVCKFLKINLPETDPQGCSKDDLENFKKTIELEENAVNLYSEFAKQATEQPIKIFFTGLFQAEQDHVELINNYLQ